MTFRFFLELPAIVVEVTAEQLATLERLFPVLMKHKAAVHLPGRKTIDPDRVIREADLEVTVHTPPPLGASDPTGALRPPPPIFRCERDGATFDRAAGLGVHRWNVHKIRGKK